MRFLTIYILLFVLIGCHLTPTAGSANRDEVVSRDELIGQWEFKSCLNLADSIIQKEQGFAFWMKFSGDSVILSDSNNKWIFAMATRWHYQQGVWRQKGDTLFINILESGNISTNTGMPTSAPKFYPIPSDSLDEKAIRFICKKVDEDQLKFFPLDRFMFSSPSESRSKRKNEFTINYHRSLGISDDELFIMRKSSENHWWSNKI